MSAQTFWRRGGGEDFVKFCLAPKKYVSPLKSPQILRPGSATVPDGQTLVQKDVFENQLQITSQKRK